MYSWLAHFALESEGVFVESQLIKIFFSKIDKWLLHLASLRIIVDYDGRATLVQLFSIVEKCNTAICQHDPTDMVFWMTETSKSKKRPSLSSSLADIKLDHHLHYWQCGDDGLLREIPCIQSTERILFYCLSLIKKGIVKTETKPKKKQFKYNHCGRTNHNEDHSFQLHLELCTTNHVAIESQ